MLDAIPISDLARLVGVPAYRISYAVTNRFLPAPPVVAGRRLWTPADVPAVKAYFDRLAAGPPRGRPPSDGRETRTGDR